MLKVILFLFILLPTAVAGAQDIIDEPKGHDLQSARDHCDRFGAKPTHC